MAQDQDPWAAPGKGNQPSQPPSNNGKPANEPKAQEPRRDEQSPPDLEEAFTNLLKKLGGKKSAHSGQRNAAPINYNKYLPIAALIGVILWGASGFYTIKEAERGVVTRFGQLHSIVQPGLNWKPTFVDQVIPVNVEKVRNKQTKGSMLTQDENMVNVEMTVLYRIADPAKYQFSVTDADNSLAQAADSALRYVIGHMPMDNILTKERTLVRDNTLKALNDIIKPYDMGVDVIEVNFESARPPEKVKDAFDDAIKAQEDEQRYIREAEAYAREREPIARGNAQRIIEAATAYKDQVVLDAKGEVERYQRLLPEFKAAPELLKQRLYIQAMENVMAKTPKVMTDGGNNITVLPLEQLLGRRPDSDNAINSNTAASDAETSVTATVPSNMRAATNAESSNRTAQSRTKQTDEREERSTERQGRFN